MLAPPQSLHVLRMQLCSQMLAPPQSLHLRLSRLCSQMRAPPQSLPEYLWRLCSHFLRPLCGAREAHRHRLRALRAEGAAGALGAAEGGRAADGLAAHGAGEGAVMA